MGVIFEQWGEEWGVGPVLMDCSGVWGQKYVRLTEYICQEYNHPPFFYNTESIADFFFVLVPELQSLFDAVAKGDRLFLHWAEYAAGMLEIATQTILEDAWAEKEVKFRPIHSGVSTEDIPMRKNS